MNPPVHCIVGSGPAGVASAHALLEKGLNVLMLDAGLQLEPDRAQVVAQLAASVPSVWDPSQVAVLKQNMTAGAKGLPEKLVYGSDFPYRDFEQHADCSFEGVGLRPSLALGGLSNVWGAAMLPYRDADISDWPITTADLADHYAAALRLSGLSARVDDLAELFPLHTPDPGRLELSRQAGVMMDRMVRNKAALNQNGIHFGSARVAIRASLSPSDPGCVYCGMCMYGCPYGYIYNSATTVHQLQANPRFTYQPDTVVTSFAETESGVTVHARHRLTCEPMQIEASRLYLAAGAIPTTKILLESSHSFDQTLWMKDSQYFLVPLLLFKSIPDVQREALHTLSQVFVEILDSALSPNTIHLQVYSYSELISQAVRQNLARFGLNFDILAGRLEQRLVIAQGFLHSSASSKIAVTLRPASGGTRLYLKSEINPAARALVRKVAAKLGRNARKLGAIPVPPMIQVAEPGRSYHSGGTYPMRREPGPFESDILGRPHGSQRVHAVDATVLPSIPGTTVTLSVMANAHRIASQAAALPT